MPRQFTQSELVGADVVRLCTISFAGRDWRFSSKPCEADLDGETLVFIGGLNDMKCIEGCPFGDSSVGSNGATVVVQWPEDLAALIAAGHDFATARAELAVWINGSSYKHRRALVSNARVKRPTYGADGEDVRLTLSAEAYDDPSDLLTEASPVEVPPALELPIPPDAPRAVRQTLIRLRAAQASEEPLDSQRDRFIPVVFGKPGDYQDSQAVPLTGKGSPTILFRTGPRTVAIAAHVVETTKVTIVNVSTDDVFTDMAVVNEMDAAGRPVATVDVGSGVGWDDENEIWVCWDFNSPPSNRGGSKYAVSSNRPMRGLGDILQFMLQQFGRMATDRGRIAIAADQVNHLYASGYIDDTVGALEWVTGNVSKIVSLSMVAGPRGTYPFLWRTELSARDVVERVTAGKGWHRTSDVEVVDDGLVNEVTVKYAPDGSSGDFMRTVRASGGQFQQLRPANYFGLWPEIPVLPDEFGGGRRAEISFGKNAPAATEIETAIIGDNATAALVAAETAHRNALPYKTVSYDLDDDYLWIQFGDVVELTDADIHFDAERGMVETLDWGIDTTTATVAIPPR